MANNSAYPRFETAMYKKPIITLSTATLTLSEDQSGSLILFDKTDGATITLPANCALGTTFEFNVKTAATSSGVYKIITGAAAELMAGLVLNCDTDTTDTVAVWKSLVATSNISVNLNANTTGGLIGSTITCTKIKTTLWQVNGMLLSTGTVATPFATS